MEVDLIEFETLGHATQSQPDSGVATKTNKTGIFRRLLAGASQTFRRSTAKSRHLDAWSYFHDLATECTVRNSELTDLPPETPESERATAKYRANASTISFINACNVIGDDLILGFSDQLDNEGECFRVASETAEMVSTYTQAGKRPTQTDIWDIAVAHNYESTLDAMRSRQKTEFGRNPDIDINSEDYTTQAHKPARKCLSTPTTRETTTSWTRALLELRCATMMKCI